MGVASHRGLQIRSAARSTTFRMWHIQIIQLASSSLTRFEGDLASGKSRRVLPMAPPHVILHPWPSPILCVPHALINCAYVNERGRPGTEATQSTYVHNNGIQGYKKCGALPITNA